MIKHDENRDCRLIRKHDSPPAHSLPLPSAALLLCSPTRGFLLLPATNITPSLQMAAQIFNAIGKVGLGLAVVGATASQALYNGESAHDAT